MIPYPDYWREHRHTPATMHDFIRLVFKLQRIQHRHGRGDGRQAEWLVMMAHALAEAEGREADITSVTAQSGLPRSTVKRVIDAMEKSGRLRLERSPSDARRRIIRQTPSSRRETLHMICDMIDAMVDFSRTVATPPPTPAG
ncbi:MAG: hypothetical protein AB7G39_15355 [Alphaproteobacteria bacterium]